MRKYGKITLGCLIRIVIVLILAAAAWKALNFFILNPSRVKAEMNAIHEELKDVHRHMSAEEYPVVFRSNWDSIRVNTHDNNIRFSSGPTVNGDTIIIRYTDSICFPALPTYTRDFKVTRRFLRW